VASGEGKLRHYERVASGEGKLRHYERVASGEDELRRYGGWYRAKPSFATTQRPCIRAIRVRNP
jgi:hypothetical protein